MTRDRRLVVRHGVRIGDAVLDAGGGTGSTSLLAGDRVGWKVAVPGFGSSDCGACPAHLLVGTR